jgi:sulfite reductase (NADPH) hemoprotein beta-component
MPAATTMSAISAFSASRSGRNSTRSRSAGPPGENAAIGEIIGPGFLAEQVPGAIETIVDTYLAVRRDPAEPFLLAYRRVGEAPFKEALYGTR